MEDFAEQSGRDRPAGPERQPASGPDPRDERRLHLRAYNYWAHRLGERSYPASADLAPEPPPEFAPFALVLDCAEQQATPAVRFVGARLAAAQSPAGSESLDERSAAALLAEIERRCRQALASRAPVAFDGEFSDPGVQTILYRGILLPFASPAGEIDLIYAIANWKARPARPTTSEAGDDADEAAELGPLATPTRDRPPLAVWADGPTAGDATLAGLTFNGTEPHPEAGELTLILARRLPDGDLVLLGEVAANPDLLARAASLVLG
jgi:hypothetical protein